MCRWVSVTFLQKFSLVYKNMLFYHCSTTKLHSNSYGEWIVLTFGKFMPVQNYAEKTCRDEILEGPRRIVNVLVGKKANGTVPYSDWALDESIRVTLKPDSEMHEI